MKGSSYPKFRPYILVSGTWVHFSLGSHFTILIVCKTIDRFNCQGQIIHNSKSAFGGVMGVAGGNGGIVEDTNGSSAQCLKLK